MKLPRLLPAAISLLLAFAPMAVFATDKNSARPMPTPISAAAPAKAKSVVWAKPALWKVSDDDTTIWLFGTIHILPPGINWYSGSVAKALEGSDTLVTEIVDATDPETQAKISQIALSDPAANLRDDLPADLRVEYEAALTSLRFPVSAFDAHDPWYAAVALSTLPLMKEGFGTMNGAETLLIANATGKPHIGLETAESQLTLFDSLPRQTQIKYLGEVIKGLPDVRKDVFAMVDAWKNGNAGTLAKLMNEDETDPVLRQVLLVDRNTAWAKWIKDRLEQPGSVFVAVGAGHLAGTDSVQELLTKAGIKAKRVR